MGRDPGKDPAGRGLGAYRAIMRPHWLVGLGKAVWKGNAEQLAARLAAEIDPRAWWIVPALASWVLIELGLLGRRWWPRREPVGRLRAA